jgi:hypothetical protein
MKVFGIFVFNCNEPNAVILSKCLELSSFGYFQVSDIIEYWRRIMHSCSRAFLRRAVEIVCRGRNEVRRTRTDKENDRQTSLGFRLFVLRCCSSLTSLFTITFDIEY